MSNDFVFHGSTGIRDLKHLTEKCKRLKSRSDRLDSIMKLHFFSKVEQLNESNQIGRRQHNEEVMKNHHLLSRITDCVKFCEAFELALLGHDKNADSDNPGIFCGLERKFMFK